MCKSTPSGPAGEAAEAPARPETALAACISPAFYGVHRDVTAHGHTHYLLTGGRGSCKSTFAAVEVLLLLKRHPQCHALVMRKVAATLRDSVFAQYVWAAELLGVADEFEQRRAPPELVHRATGQRVLFRGADDKTKLKSLKMPFGYIAVTHFEEKDQFDSRAELRSILQTTMRGGALFWNFETNNPPVRPAHWANRDLLDARPDRLVHHSDYRSVPPAWLGAQFFAEAEALRAQNETAYRHEYLGEATGLGAQVFPNVRLATVTDAELAACGQVYRGVDWGFFPDPLAFVCAYYDAARRVLTVFDELTAYRQNNAETAALAKAKGADMRATVWADAAEPKSIADWRGHGILCRPAGKGPGSVVYSVKWLAGLTAIVIDPARCPDTAREFTACEYVRSRDGEVTEALPDRDNHHIDAVRYALYPVWRRRGQ